MERLSGMKRALDKHAEIFVTVIASILLIAVVAIWIVSSAGLEAIRDFGLLIAAIIAFPLGFWRSRVAERQASAAQQQVSATQQQLRTAQHQADAAQRQADTAQQNLLNERYQKGAEMLGSEALAVRLGGIYALQRLAEEHPEQYHVQIMRLFCAFIRNPTVEADGKVGLANNETGEATETHDGRGRGRARQDVEAVMEAIATRSKIGIDLERDAEFQLDLRGAQFGGMNLMNFKHVNLSWANLSFADMSCVNIRPLTDMSWIHAVSADLSGACLVDVNLSMTQFIGADLSGTLLHGANLSSAVFSDRNKDTPCRLTQAQLDEARADPDNPPKLDGVLDAETGEQLVWRGKRFDSRKKQ